MKLIKKMSHIALIGCLLLLLNACGGSGYRQVSYYNDGWNDSMHYDSWHRRDVDIDIDVVAPPRRDRPELKPRPPRMPPARPRVPRR